MKTPTASHAPPIRSHRSAGACAARRARPTAAAAMWTRRSPSGRSSVSSPTGSVPRPATTPSTARPPTTTCCRPIAGEYERVAVVGAGVSGLTVAHDLVQDRLQGHRVRSQRGTGRHAHRRGAGLPPAARPGAPRDPGHSLAGRGPEVQHAAGPRFHHRQPARATATRAIFLGIGLPKGRKLPLPGAECRRRASTAWIFCAPSTPARRCRWASASW